MDPEVLVLVEKCAAVYLAALGKARREHPEAEKD